jgi:hypothetical protein
MDRAWRDRVSEATAVLACGTAPTASLDDTDQAFLFELEYASSWVPTWTGLAIDRKGEITSYAREGAPWVPAEADSFTAEELQAKYGANPTVIGQLDRATLEHRFRQIAEVGNDFSSPNVACADAGSFRYTAFAYNESTRRYRPLRLREEGDSPAQNQGKSVFPTGFGGLGRRSYRLGRSPARRPTRFRTSSTMG